MYYSSEPLAEKKPHSKGAQKSREEKTERKKIEKGS